MGDVLDWTGGTFWEPVAENGLLQLMSSNGHVHDETLGRFAAVMRVLGVDLGKVRIGLAVMDWESGVVTPRKALAGIGTLVKDADQVVEVAREEEAGMVVVGLPLENGEEGKMANVMRRFGAILGREGAEGRLCGRVVDELRVGRSDAGGGG